MALDSLNTQISMTNGDNSYAKGKRSKRPRSGDNSPPPTSSSSLYGSPPKTEEEYLAFCLILLAHGGAGATEYEGPVVLSPAEKAPVSVVPAAGADSYVCVECGRGFSSYQALGGHKASHRKVSSDAAGEKDKPSASSSSGEGNHNVGDGKAHECGICHMVFPSGQALGGHKRRHFEGKIGTGSGRKQNVGGAKTASSSESGSRSRSEVSAGAGQSSSSQTGVVSLIDLNLPAEIIPEDDDFLCRLPAEEVLSPVFSPTAKRPKLLSFDVLCSK